MKKVILSAAFLLVFAGLALAGTNPQNHPIKKHRHHHHHPHHRAHHPK